MNPSIPHGEKRLPTDLAEPRLSPDDCFVWGEECEYAIQSNRKRATAIGFFAQEAGIRFQDVVCRREYLRLLTRQESWEAHAYDRTEGDIVPDDWKPGENDPVWGFCAKDCDDAIPCWSLEEKGVTVASRTESKP